MFFVRLMVTHESSCKLKDATSKDANKIIKLIHNKYNGYIIEVKFVED